MKNGLTLLGTCKKEELMNLCLEVLKGQLTLFCVPKPTDRLFAVPRNELKSFRESLNDFVYAERIGFTPIYRDSPWEAIKQNDFLCRESVLELSEREAKIHAHKVLNRGSNKCNSSVLRKLGQKAPYDILCKGVECRVLTPP